MTLSGLKLGLKVSLINVVDKLCIRKCYVQILIIHAAIWVLFQDGYISAWQQLQLLQLFYESIGFSNVFLRINSNTRLAFKSNFFLWFGFLPGLQTVCFGKRTQNIFQCGQALRFFLYVHVLLGLLIYSFLCVIWYKLRFQNHKQNLPPLDLWSLERKYLSLLSSSLDL